MHLARVSERTEELATTVGPLETLLALARLQDALAACDLIADGAVIDIRQARDVLEATEAVLARAEVRIEELNGVLQGR